MNTLIEMSLDDWHEKYKPIANHIDKNSAWDGLMFETYEEEEKFIYGYDYRNVWTYGDGDDGGTYLWSGRSFVNRIGYFITEVAWDENEDIQVLVMEPDEEEEEEE